MTQPLYPRGKSPWYLLDRGWVGPEAGIDTAAKRKKILAPATNRTPIVQPVA